MLTPDESLFIHTVADIQDRAVKGTFYDFVRATALLRQMFFDGSKSLLQKANHRHKLKLTYSVSYKDETFENSGYNENTFLEWRIIHGHKFIITDNELFKVAVLIFHGQHFNVKDIIKYTSHVIGGIHLGSTKDDKERLFQLFQYSFLKPKNDFESAMQNPLMHSLFSIILICVNGFLPLVAAIKAHTDAGGVSPQS